MQEPRKKLNAVELTPYITGGAQEKPAGNPGEDQGYTREIIRYYTLEIVIIACLVAIIVSTTTYILTAPIQTDTDVLLYMISMLLAPSAYVLLLLHAFILYIIYRDERTSTSFTLDLTYFMYALIAGGTLYALWVLYATFSISTQLFTPGWNIAVLLLFIEVGLALSLATSATKKMLPKVFPHFVTEPKKKKKIKQILTKKRIKVRKKTLWAHPRILRYRPNISLWEDQECFVKYHM